MRKRILSVLLLLMLILGICGCEKQRWDIDWNLHGIWIDADGNEQQSVSFTITGNAEYDSGSKEFQLVELNITWPENFRFTNSAEEEYQTSVLIRHDGELIFTDTILSDDTQTGQIASGRFGLAPDKEYFIIYWDNVEGYLIASTDPEASHEEIEAYFKQIMTDERFQ